MQFKTEVQKQFEKAGWFESRNTENKLIQKISNYIDLPNHLKDFLKSYCDLIIEDCKPSKSEVINTLDTTIKFIKNNSEKNLPFSDVLYKVGYYYPDHYFVYTDSNGAVFLAGDRYFKISDTFTEGIEKIIEDNWTNYFEWNPETNQWVDEY
ncbi:hypothetical protein GCM10007424_20490 [Flavobacterium suaedae]|uniref:SMI1/KNR4 family protein n=1 Tax=Flavobacterium suaedae TaxID=1767027 RepID=A0ABQ1JXF8_9FLAO|nr:hypothetical protein [Flavobacterium suaedae]GGB80283.1 hypothetical protein GCM10007424_20490 [Flavobacterium suaedae]